MMPDMNISRMILMSVFAMGLTAHGTAVHAQETSPPEAEQREPLVVQPTFEDEATSRLIQAEDKNYVSLSYENDLIGGGTDSNYTSGLRATWFNTGFAVPDFLEEMDDVLPGVDFNTTTSTFYTFGQNIYTPEDITIRDEQPDDRPWAAFLYGSAGLVTASNNHIDEFELTLGMVGSAALGEQVQKAVHRHVTDSNLPRGWSNQLKSEPGLILSAGRRWPRAAYADFGDFRFQVEPNINVSLGNIYTYAGAGLNFTFGPYQGYLQDTPPRVRPSMPGSGYFDTPDQGWSWYAFAGVDGRAVGRNIFLDGNTFRDSPRVSKKHLVGDASAGLALTYGDYRISYSYNVRSKEFDGQSAPSEFGSITLTTKF